MIDRWLGVSHRVGSELCYFVMNKKGNILFHTTIQYITNDK